jgi:hypothetical protein
MCGWSSEASVFGSRVKRARRSASCANASGRILIGVAIQLRIAGAVHLADAAFADRRSDFVDAEARAGCQGQSLGNYMGETGRRAT